MANKWVLNSSETPLSFLLIQLLIAVVLLAICRASGRLHFSMGWRIDLEATKALAPLIILNVFGLSFNTYCLKFVDASFYQVARGLVLPFTVVTSYIFLKSRPSLRILLSCFVVFCGFLVGVSPSKSAQSSDSRGFTFIGIVFGLLSSVVTACHVVIIKRSLGVLNNSALDLAWYSNVLTALVLLPGVFLVGEWPELVDLFTNAPAVKFHTFVWGCALTGFIGFLISVAGILSVKITSPITHMVSSAVRGVGATLLGLWLFQDVITVQRALSILAILAGSLWYTWIKHQESVPADTGRGDYQKISMTNLEEANDKEERAG